jgi:2-polyprenyl-6-methoxyphenol hydroxylase-like FAD-dependent oxidoreductase
MRGKLAEILDARSRWVSEDVKKKGGKGIEYIFGDYLMAIEQDNEQVRAQFANGKDWRSYDIVVAADGLQSGTRRMVWGEDSEEDRVKSLNTYGAFFGIPEGQTDTMWRRWYHAPGRRSCMVRPNKGAGNTTVFMMVINDEDQRLADAARRDFGGVDAQKSIMAEYFRDVGWETPRILKGMMATKDFYYDMVAQVKMEHFSKGRVVLLGDAG